MKKGTFAPKLTNALKRRVQFLLVHEGVSQAEAARLVGVSKRTICVWNKKHKWSEKQKDKSDKLKFDDSLNAFIAFNKLKHPESVELLNTLYANFKSSI